MKHATSKQTLPAVLPPSKATLGDLANAANAAHARSLAAAGAALAYAIEAGRALNLARDEIGRGGWEKWLEANCANIQIRNAQLYMQLARAAESPEIAEKIAGMPIRVAAKIVRSAQAREALNGTPGTRSDQWYTPPHIADLATAAMGGSIDLDPCGHLASPVKAKETYYERGMDKPWRGAVYLNPPFSEVAEWVSRLTNDFNEGHVTCAVALVAARTDTEWFQRFADFPICLVDGRLRYSNSAHAANFPTIAVYLGRDIDLFAKTFAAVGRIYVPYSKGLRNAPAA